MSVPEIKTPLPGPRATELIARDGRSVSPSYTRAYPFVIERGQGAIVEDVDGNRFLDCAAGIAVNSTGHSHPDVVRAIIEQAQRYLHMSGTDFYYEPQVKLAEKMAAIAPIDGPSRTFFANSGTEANEAALKLARWYTRRQYFIAFIGSFHGRTFGSMALTSSKPVQRQWFGPLMPGVYHAPYPDRYRCALGTDASGCGAACLAFIEDQILGHLVSPEEVAGIVVEPIQGEGGYIVAPPDFMHGLRELATRHGIMLIVDEVQSGMGRSGKMFACEHDGIHPDIVTAAKGIASGLPLGTTTARADVMRWPPGAHASTFGGNPVSCAAALATIKLLEDELVANAATVGGHLLAGLRDLMNKHEIIGDVRGRGLMIGVELVRDRKTKERAHEEREAVVDAAFRRGLLLLGAGRNAVRFSPPLVLTREQADIALRIFDEAITEVVASRLTASSR